MILGALLVEAGSLRATNSSLTSLALTLLGRRRPSAPLGGTSLSLGAAAMPAAEHLIECQSLKALTAFFGRGKWRH